jgi:hypothetical protein
MAMSEAHHRSFSNNLSTVVVILLIAISGNLLVVGSRGSRYDSGGYSGSAHVFKRTDNGSWIEVSKLTANGVTTDRFGTRVDISNGIIAVSELESQELYLFRNVSEDYSVWTEVARLAIPRSTFGFDLHEDRLVIGKPHYNAEEPYTATLYQRKPGDLWIEKARLFASDRQALNSFGNPVAIGRSFVAASHPSDRETGSVYVIELPYPQSPRRPGGRRY